MNKVRSLTISRQKLNQKESYSSNIVINEYDDESS